MFNVFFYLFIYLLGLRSGNKHRSHFISFFTGQPALFLRSHSFSVCLPLFPSLQLSKLKRLLALQRESCRPSCPLIKQIVITHTHTLTQTCVHAHTDVSLSLSAFLSIWPRNLRRSSMCCGSLTYAGRSMNYSRPGGS